MSNPMTSPEWPPWVVLHIPHESTTLPADVRSRLLLDDENLRNEVIRMTDHLTGELFTGNAAETTVVRAPVSRLVVDVERFPDDADEPMASRGMGAVYTTTSQRTPLRADISKRERERLMRDYYHPHHARLETAVASAIDRYGRCTLIDCHSFPSVALPYECADHSRERPDICIGTDDFHTRSALTDAFVRAFQQAGWRVGLNDPFRGALVPRSRYRKDARVEAVMVEINRGLYLRETDATPLAGFADIAERIRGCCRDALEAC